MAIEQEAFVGKKGEIRPKKPIRDAADIKPGDKVLIRAYKGEYIIKKIYSIDDALDMPVIARGTPESIEKELEEEAKILESGN